MCPDFSTSAEGGSQALYKFSGSKSFRWDPGPSQQHRPRKPATGVLSSGLCIAGRPGAELLSRRLRHLLRSDRRREACRATWRRSAPLP